MEFGGKVLQTANNQLQFPLLASSANAGVPERGEPLINRLMLRAGRLVAPERPDEVVVSKRSQTAMRSSPATRCAR